MSKTFKVGQRVRCVDISAGDASFHLVLGRTYEVAGFRGGDEIMLKDGAMSWMAHRFEAVEPECSSGPMQNDDFPQAFHDGAIRHDTGKPLVSLIPHEAIMAEAEVFTFGAGKYAPHNWRKGMTYSRVLNSAMRHLLAIIGGQDNDAETGLPHAAHVRANMAFLLAYMATGTGADDRYKGGTL